MSDPLAPKASDGVVPGAAVARVGPWAELGEVLRLSLPIIITMSSVTVMNFVTLVMVGRHSATELAAFTPASSTFMLIVSFLMGTLTITNTLVAQSVGRGAKIEAPSYVWQSMYVSVIWALVSALLIPLAPALFALAGHEPAVQRHEAAYLQHVLPCMAGFGFWLSLSAFYQATKRPVVPMVVGLAADGFCLLANYALIYGKLGFPEMGMTGAAMAMVVTMYLQAGVMLVIFLSGRTRAEYESWRGMGLHLRKVWQIVRYGVPAGASWVLDNGSWTVFFLAVVGWLGEAAQAATNAAVQVEWFSFMPVWGLTVGVQALVGQHIGRRDFAGAKSRVYRALGAAVVYMVFMGVMMFVFRGPLIRMFIDPETPKETFDEIVRLGSIVLVFAALYQAFNGVAMITYGALTGAGDTRVPMLITVFCNWLVFVPLALLLTRTFRFGVIGAWAAVTVTIVLVGSITFWRFASGAWCKIDLFKDRKEEQ